MSMSKVESLRSDAVLEGRLSDEEDDTWSSLIADDVHPDRQISSCAGLPYCHGCQARAVLRGQ
jgi:hypothetical protein